MLYFCFRIEDITKKSDNYTRKNIKIFRVKKNKLTRVANEVYDHMDDFQAFITTCEEKKLLPKKAFVRHPTGGHLMGSDKLRAEGICSVQQI